jgi:hypothetical protein
MISSFFTFKRVMTIVHDAKCCYTCKFARDPGYEDQTFVRCVIDDFLDWGAIEHEVIVRVWNVCKKHENVAGRGRKVTPTWRSV